MDNPFVGLDTSRRKDKCVIGEMRDGLDDEMRGYLDDALANKKISDGKIAETLAPLVNRRYATSTVGRHRERLCACFLGNGNG